MKFVLNVDYLNIIAPVMKILSNTILPIIYLSLVIGIFASIYYLTNRSYVQKEIRFGGICIRVYYKGDVISSELLPINSPDSTICRVYNESINLLERAKNIENSQCK